MTSFLQNILAAANRLQAEVEMPIGGRVWGGLIIIASPNWPTELVGHEVTEIVAHPGIRWLLRLLRISEHVCWVATGEIRIDRDPVIDHARGVVYCSKAQEREILRRTVVRVPKASTGSENPLFKGTFS